MKKIAIIAAMSSEINSIKALLSNREEKDGYITGGIGDKEIILIQSGIGKVCAAVKTTELIDKFSPDCVINSGVAGGVGDEVKQMDIVVGTKTVYNDVWCLEPNAYGQVQDFPLYFEADKNLSDKIDEGNHNGITIHKGLIASGDKFVAGIEEAKNIRRLFQATLAVDMESCAVAQVCYMKKTPFISLRIISDNPLRSNDNHQQYADFWGEMANKSFAVLKNLLNRI